MSDAENFRQGATVLLWAVYAVLAVGTLALGFLGWRVGGVVGAGVGTGMGLVASVVLGIASTIMWALTQDGA